jgi:tetratricopeptide (TPR) repeat protein
VGLQIFETAAQKRMVRRSKAFLRSHDWHVSDDTGTEDRRLDFVAKKHHMMLNFSCTDDDNRKYKNNEKLFNEIYEFNAQIKRNRGQATAWILESELKGYSNAQMAEMGIIVLLPAELQLLANIHRFEKELPIGISPQEIALLSASFTDCVDIANAFELAGENEAAIEWLHRAIRAYGRFSSAYWKLFCLLERIGDLDRAEEVAGLALQLRRNDPGFLRGMEKLELGRGRTEKAAAWRARLDQKTENAPRPLTFEQMMKSRPPSVREGQLDKSSSDTGWKDAGSWLQRLFTLRR